jgi:hypothetical protein
MYLGFETRGRLVSEMRWRVAALVALSGMVALPTVSDGAQPTTTGAVSVSVKPRTGSGRTHFAVSFRAAVASGRTFHNLYRITAGTGTHAGCQAGVGMTAAPTRVGSTVRVVLAPGGSKRWCAGTFHGQVWDVITVVCPPREACPAIEPLPHQVGKFSFRVTGG